MYLTCNSVVVLTRDNVLRSAAVTAAAAPDVVCHLTPFAGDFAAPWVTTAPSW